MKIILIILLLIKSSAFAEKKEINDFEGKFKILSYQETQPLDAHEKFFETSVFIKASYIGNKETPDWLKKETFWVEFMKGKKTETVRIIFLMKSVRRRILLRIINNIQE